MKRILLVPFLILIAVVAHAQLLVDSLGSVQIGEDSTYIHFGANSNGQEASVSLLNSNNRYGFYSQSLHTIGTPTYGKYSYVRNYMGNCYGEKITSLGNADMRPSQQALGMIVNSGFANTAVSVFGGKSGAASYFVGIYGSEMGSVAFASRYADIYAGFFVGKVRVTGSIYGTLLSPTINANSISDGTAVLSLDEDCVTGRLSRVQTIQFLREDPTAAFAEEERLVNEEDLKGMSDEEKEVFMAEDVAPKSQLSSVQYGLAADQLKEVYPELVYEDKNGNVSINYVEMIPLLVKSINELSAEVAALKGEPRKQAKAVAAGLDTDNSFSAASMEQNKPNPFNGSTTIEFNIPDAVGQAMLCIYDLSGKQIKSQNIVARGMTSIVVSASDLAPGMYIYSLITDGQICVTKRMVVTE